LATIESTAQSGVELNGTKQKAMTTNLRPAAVSNILGMPIYIPSFSTKVTNSGYAAPKAQTQTSWAYKPPGLSGLSAPYAPYAQGQKQSRPWSMPFSTGWTMPSIGLGASSLSSSSISGNYILQVFFYIFLYAFVIFLIAILVHFTIRPIFIFTPGGKGLINIPTQSDNLVYWTNGKQPAPEARAPSQGDSLSRFLFNNNFSVSLDVYVRAMNETNTNRIILYKTYAYGSDLSPAIPAPFTPAQRSRVLTLSETVTSTSATVQSKLNSNTVTAAQLSRDQATAAAAAAALAAASSPTIAAPPDGANLITTMSSLTSMIIYLTETNDLIVTFFSGVAGTNYSCRPIKNIPLYTPFRISVVVETNIFTVYLNGRQTFQRLVPGISLNSSNSLNTLSQRFYAAPAWANTPVQTIFIQNLNLWPRAIKYEEVISAQPSLASTSNFGAPVEVGLTSCGS